MHKTKLAQKLLFVSGTIVTLMGIMHFTWPSELIQYEIFSDLSEPGKDLIVLSSLSIGLCLSTFGLLTIFSAFKIEKSRGFVFAYSLSQAILWTVRFVFEINFPVNVRIYFIKSPTTAILIGIFLLIVFYILSALLIRKKC